MPSRGQRTSVTCLMSCLLARGACSAGQPLRARPVSNFRAARRRPARYTRPMTAATRLLTEALALSDEQRAELAAELLASLPPATPAEARSEDEWVAEIERRSRAALAGSPGIPWKEAKAEIQRRLGKT